MKQRGIANGIVNEQMKQRGIVNEIVNEQAKQKGKMRMNMKMKKLSMKELSKRALSFVVMAAVLAASLMLPGNIPDEVFAAEVSSTITVNLDAPQRDINPLLYGMFFEDLCNSGEGGVYAEMVRNRSFEEDYIENYFDFKSENNGFIPDGAGNPKGAQLLGGAETVHESESASNVLTITDPNASSGAKIPNNIIKPDTEEFTISTWINPAKHPANVFTRIFEWGDNVYYFGEGGYGRITLTSTSNVNTMLYVIEAPGLGQQTVSSTTRPPVGAWSLVTFTYAKTGTSPDRWTGTIYLNGVAVGTNAGFTISPSAIGVNEYNYIGRPRPSAAENYNNADPSCEGEISNFRYYDRPLSLTEIAGIYAEGTIPTEANLPPAVWSFEENSGEITLTGPAGGASYDSMVTKYEDYLSLPDGANGTGLQLPDNLIGDDSRALTLSVWVNPDGATNAPILDLSDGTTSERLLIETYNNNNRLRLTLTTLGGTMTLDGNNSEATRLVEGQWNNVLAKFTPHMAWLIVNGVTAASIENGALSPAAIGSKAKFNYIGRNYNASVPSFRGAVCDFRLYKYGIGGDAGGYIGKGEFAEMLAGRNAFSKYAPKYWSFDGAGTGSVAYLDRGAGINAMRKAYLRWENTAAVSASNPTSLTNSGYWGMAVKDAVTYDFSVWAKQGTGVDRINVALKSEDGTMTYASKTISLDSAEWKKYETTLSAVGTDLKGVLVLSSDQPGDFWLDMVSLFPPTYKGRPNGVNLEYGEKLEALAPKTHRFAGGCITEGWCNVTCLKFADMVGPVEARPSTRGHWNYENSNGFGFLEHLQLAEDVGAEPIYVINTASGHGWYEILGTPEYDWYVQDVLNAIEYANGGADTYWGARRIADGHPAPFNLKMIEIGNEIWGSTPGATYLQVFQTFGNAILAKYPDMILISDNNLDGYNVGDPIWDYHDYPGVNGALQQAARDNLIFTRPQHDNTRVFVGEFMTMSNPLPENGYMNGGLYDGAWLTGMERNSDLIQMFTYAPIIQHKENQYHNTAVYFHDNEGVDVTPSYYVQQMFAENLGDKSFPITASNNAHPSVSNAQRGYYVGNYETVTGDVIIKAVNVTGDSIVGQLNISGVGNLESTGEATVLSNISSGSPDDQFRITPQSKSVTGVTEQMSYTFEPYSVTVLRLHTRPQSGAIATLDHANLLLDIGGDGSDAESILIATVTPVDAPDKSVTWSSSDESIVKLEAIPGDGLSVRVIGVAEGTAIVTATTVDGNKASCTVTVEDKDAVNRSNITVDLSAPRNDINPNFYGMFVEDVCNYIEGGLYAEMVRNRSFEEGFIDNWFKFDTDVNEFIADDAGNPKGAQLLGGAVIDSYDETEYNILKISNPSPDTGAKIPDGLIKSDLENFTVSVWVKPDSRGTRYDRLFEFGDNSNYNMQTPNRITLTSTTPSGQMYFGIDVAGRGSQSITTAAGVQPPVGVWSLATATYARISPEAFLGTIYLDGEKVAESSGFILKPGDIGVNDHNYLGRLRPSPISGTTDSSFVGDMKDFRFYERALSQEEVRKIFLDASDKPVDSVWSFEDNRVDMVMTGAPGGAEFYDVWRNSGGALLLADGAPATGVKLPDDIFDDDTTSTTISLWVKPSEYVPGASIFDFSDGTVNKRMSLVVDQSNRLVFTITSGGTSAVLTGNANSQLTLGAWSNVTVRITPSVGQMYINGVRNVRSASFSKTPADVGAAAIYNYIGRAHDANAGVGSFKGEISDFRIYKYGLGFDPGGYGGKGELAELWSKAERSFAYTKDTAMYWSFDDNGTGSSVFLDRENLLGDAQKSALRWSNKEQVSASNPSILTNTGYWGMSMKEGVTYDFSLWAKQGTGEGSGANRINVALKSEDGNTTYASGVINLNSSEWKKYETQLTSNGTNPRAILVLTADQPGQFWLDMVSLFPPTFMGRPNGANMELGQKLLELAPKFSRFAGGCILEGWDINTFLSFDKSVGPVEERPSSMGHWNYENSNGFGFLENLQFCEDIGAEPIYVTNCGYGHEWLIAMDDPRFEWFIQDVLNAMEYANGDETTYWGAKRIADGRVEPFNLKMIEIGNENEGGDRYLQRFVRFRDAIMAKYPDAEVLCDAIDYGAYFADDPYGKPIWDGHHYPSVLDAYWFGSGNNMEKHYTQNLHTDLHTSRVLLGEIMTVGTEPLPENGYMNGSLGDAAYFAACERYSDGIKMVTYAPYLINMNNLWHWSNVLYFDNEEVHTTPSYFVQQMFDQNLGDESFAITADNNDYRTHPNGDMLQKGYYVGNYKTDSGDVIIKAVNVTGEPINGRLSILGADEEYSWGEAIVLSNQSSGTPNRQDRITPQTVPLENLSAQFSYTFEPYSITVLRLHVKEEPIPSGYAVPSASVKKLNGNQNELTITVKEYDENGLLVNVIVKTFMIANNSAGTYQVGEYSVYVDTKGNTQIRDCRIIAGG